MINLSILIATHNRYQMLSTVLRSINDQKTDHTFDYEVIIIDNNSTDQTRSIVESFIPQFKHQLHYLFEPQKGKSFALNKGIEKSIGDILVFTDDDTIADESWLLNIVECFKKNGCDGLGGRIITEYPLNTPAWIRTNADILSGPIVLYDYGEDSIPFNKSMHKFLGANFAFKKALFKELGGFNTKIGPGLGSMGEDTEIVTRFIKANKILFYCGKAIMRHPLEKSRMNLKYISQWNISLGRFRIISDEQEHIDLSLVYWFGIPRYLILQMIHNLTKLLINIFNRRQFLLALIDLTRNWGKARETRRIFLEKK